MSATCLGWGAVEGVCTNEAGSKTSPLWCQSCEDARLAYLSQRFSEIDARFNPGRAVEPSQ